MNHHLLTVDNAKTSKGEALGYLTGILYMSPADMGADGANLCPYSTPGCRAACLNTAGRGAFSSVQAGRARKRALYLNDAAAFFNSLALEVEALERRAKREGLRPVVRLNGTTDLQWERDRDAVRLMRDFPRVQFYDYTKIAPRLAPDNLRPRNYDLTYSRGERRDAAARAVLAAGGRVAVVFNTRRGEALPATWYGTRVVDGDAHDLRFLDPRGVVVGLRAKGRAKADRSGFVVDVARGEVG